MKKILRMLAVSVILGTTFVASCAAPSNDNNQGDNNDNENPDNNNNNDNTGGDNEDQEGDNNNPDGDNNGDNQGGEEIPDPKPDPVISKALKITSMPTKVEYRVNESLSFEGLEVKLFTTTDDVEDEGVIYTNFTPSVEEGYVFQEKDITSMTNVFEVILIANEENVRSTTFELTVLEEEKVPVEITTTLFDFMSRLNAGEAYEIITPYAKGTFLSNAIYWDVLKNGGSIASSYGFAFRDSDKKTILFSEDPENSSSYILHYELGNRFSSIYDDKLYETLQDPYPYQSFYHAKSINSYNLKKFKNLKPKKDTHRYTIKPESKATYDPAWDGSDELVNYYTKYVSQFLRLSSNYSNFPLSDFALGTIYSNLTITAEFVTNDELSVFVNTTSSDVLWPSEFTIKITDKADIPSIKGFLDGTDEGSEGEDTRDPDSEVEGGTGEGI